MSEIMSVLIVFYDKNIKYESMSSLGEDSNYNSDFSPLNLLICLLMTFRTVEYRQGEYLWRMGLMRVLMRSGDYCFLPMMQFYSMLARITTLWNVYFRGSYSAISYCH